MSRSGSAPRWRAGEGAQGTPAGWEAVIGLEVHVQLRTRSKLFSPAPNDFGAEPNTLTTEVDLGMPGALPVLNRRAVELAVRAALALGCDVHPTSVFARKHYFYPDLPKGYQISQYDEPLATGGGVPIELDGRPRVIPLIRIHMEEDAGKSIHDPAVTGGRTSHVDLNRAGVPLIEIVSEPALRSPAEAGAYLRSLRSVLRYLEVSDVDLEKGHFRCDANVSVRRTGERELGSRVELKNLNSFRYVEKAIAHEIVRQVEVLEGRGAVSQETRQWDDASGRTRPMRDKEYAEDYRYFPDPDLVALRLEPDVLDRARKRIPELPHERRARFVREYALPAADAALLTEEREIAELFEQAARAYPHPKTVANWILRDVLALLKDQGRTLADTGLTAERLAELLRLVEGGEITAATARELLPEVARSGVSPREIVRARGLEAVTDRSELEAVAKEILAASPEEARRYRAGEARLLEFFVGQLMRRTRGKASPAVAREVLIRLLGG